MGEVYRADDLTLGQSVALKFLPTEMASDPLRLERFFAEVRVARQVSHRNVCRVYDLGVVDGNHFISMELVDGDDLGGVLRQVGRFPEDKALEIARQLCAGLAAAHQQGIVHRDLKPANIMIDGRGQVRITDFGLAALVSAIGRNDVVAGTPTYMAPEQLSGLEVTERSDIYALGLVLYELFTGKAVYQPASMAELLKKHAGGTPSSLSLHVPSIDPIIDRVILRCLEKDPQKRPASPLEVAAALPGGDPLAAALAAGETPSPAMVAAAGTPGVLSPPVAVGLGLGAMVLLLLSAFVGVGSSILGVYEWTNHRFIWRRGGKRSLIVSTRIDRLWMRSGGAELLWEYLRVRAQEDESPERWSELEGGEVVIGRVWYRSSPKRLNPHPGFATVTRTDPPQVDAGDSLVVLDDRGRLRSYSRVPPRFTDPDLQKTGALPTDWSLFFEEAGLDAESFTTVVPTRTPSVNTDSRAAWEGADWDDPERTLHIEAGAFGGELVYFQIFEPWMKPVMESAPEVTSGQRFAEAANLFLAIGLLLGGVWLARRNIKVGRSDLGGASRVALWFLIVHSVVWVFWAHHAPFSELGSELEVFSMDTGYNLFMAASLWVFYVGLEPFVRRRWPESLIGWSRLLAGRWKDPLVGRDLLYGAVCGGVFGLLGRIAGGLPSWLGLAPRTPNGAYLAIDLGDSLAWVIDKPVHALTSVMQAMFLIVLLSFLIRNRNGAAIGAGLIFLSLSVVSDPYPWLTLPFSGLAIGAIVWLLIRHGMLAATMALTLITMSATLPLSTDLGAWYQGTNWVSLGIVGALLIFASRIASGEDSLLSEARLEG